MTVSSTSPAEAASVDEILDANAVGLLYFERFLPLAERVSGSEVPRYDEVCARYDEQRGLNLEALTSDADAVGAMAAALGEQLDEQAQLLIVLRLRWHGDAGETAQRYVATEQERAGVLLDSVEDALQTMYAAVDVLREAVTDKAELVGSLDTDAVEGHDPDRIDALLLASGIEGVPVDRATVFARLASAFPEWAERFARADVSDEFAAEVADRSREWIEGEFVPHVQRTCAAVSSACTATDTAVRECLALVVKVIEEVVHPVFDELDERSWVPLAVAEKSSERSSPENCPAAVTAGAGGEAAVTGPASAAHPPSEVPASAPPAQPAPAPDARATGPTAWGETENDNGREDSRVDAVAGLVDGIVDDIVDRVVEALGDTTGDGSVRDETDADPTAEPDPTEGSNPTAVPNPTATLDDPPDSIPSPEFGDASKVVGERGHLEAELDGHRARIALEHDGAVSLRLETPGLGVRTFELRVGLFGLPEIVEVPGTVDPSGVGVSNRSSATVEPPEPAAGDRTATDAGPETEPAPPSAESGAPEPNTATSPPVDVAPADEPQVGSEPTDLQPASTADTPEVCVPETSGEERSVRQGSNETHEVPAAPVAPPVTEPQPSSAGSGAGLSEAGAL
ncbi:hypothetical protein HQO90_23115 [Rhodococcus fascians]|nr:hypothetical protein [Rhodococcus fascians]MBY4060083.1 hypothetical protein [Rhodococcus fascians]MBY4068901.1 hypothetical protein [Rhodococcus fascians]